MEIKIILTTENQKYYGVGKQKFWHEISDEIYTGIGMHLEQFKGFPNCKACVI